MKKPSVIIGKKQIVLAGMTLILGIAVYINYAVSSAGTPIKATDKIEQHSVNYGQAELVNANASDSSNSIDYFSQARIERMNARDQAKETLKTIMSGGDSTEEEKAVAAEDAAAMSGLIESEAKIENLVKAAGFTDCVCYLDGSNANIVVKAGEEGLIASEAAQIKDILLGEVSVPAENIRIFDVS